MCHLWLFLQLLIIFEIFVTILWLHYNYWKLQPSMQMIFMRIFIQEQGNKSH
jgi:hypothetical protein